MKLAFEILDIENCKIVEISRIRSALLTRPKNKASIIPESIINEALESYDKTPL